ncbi:flagellar biosynthetic protein FliO [Curtobacterium sp. MCBD17_019]|uniref:flagellar biosynthetic protein FliO n=1 Tax=Curtobacterium sp. MCBD17_019 TaxID=2175669 RepID=UPI000DA9BE3E|nr:flagellar biosynthetic protein FliO [Curtobacterium sp. MCBD17_019]PZE75821.1 flagellar biosynthetic protein FliO [Curtobacterium sp. MCBD17_019]
MDTLVVALRVALSLGVVLALLWFVQRRVAKSTTGSSRGRGRRSAAVQVVARQGIGGKASVVVVDVEGERLVLGVTEQQVAVLASGTAPAASAAGSDAGSDATDPFRAVLAAQAAPSLPAAAQALTEEPESAAPVLRARPRNRRAAHIAVPTQQQLQGSILSADMWRQAAAAVRARRAG